MPLKKFYTSYDHNQGIHKVCLTSLIMSVKKLESYDMSNAIYLEKRVGGKNRCFSPPVSNIHLSSYDVLFSQNNQKHVFLTFRKDFSEVSCGNQKVHVLLFAEYDLRFSYVIKYSKRSNCCKKCFQYDLGAHTKYLTCRNAYSSKIASF